LSERSCTSLACKQSSISCEKNGRIAMFGAIFIPGAVRSDLLHSRSAHVYKSEHLGIALGTKPKFTETKLGSVDHLQIRPNPLAE
jgi:hypothetical protein